MEFGPIEAAGDLVSSRLIRLVNNTQVNPFAVGVSTYVCDDRVEVSRLLVM